MTEVSELPSPVPAPLMSDVHSVQQHSVQPNNMDDVAAPPPSSSPSRGGASNSPNKNLTANVSTNATTASPTGKAQTSGTFAVPEPTPSPTPAPAPAPAPAPQQATSNVQTDEKKEEKRAGPTRLKLTAGAVKVLFEKGAIPVGTAMEAKPILQMVDFVPLVAASQVLPGGGKKQRYQITLSDGVHHIKAMLSQQHNSDIDAKRLRKNAIIRVIDSINNTLPLPKDSSKAADGAPPPKILVVPKMEILVAEHTSRIGNPKDVQSATDRPASAPQPGRAPGTTGQGQSQGQGQPQGQGQRAPARPQAPPRFTPIADLNAYMGKWAIRARVAAKTPMKTWSNDRSTGKLFTFDLLDATGGQIRATAFNNQADKWFDLIEKGGVYTIENGQLRQLDRTKSWNRGQSHTCEFTVTGETKITRVADDPAIKATRYDFVKIRDLPNCKNDTVDVVGIVAEVSPITEFSSKKSSKPVSRRTIVIRDDTNTSVDVTLWGAIAKQNGEEELAGHPVVALKCLQVTEYNGISLSMGFSGTLVVSPDCKEAHDLKEWWQSADQSVEPEQLTVRTGVKTMRVTVDELEKQRIGYGDMAEYVTIRAMITQFDFREDRRPWYKACHNTIDGQNGKDRVCGKKITESEGNKYECLGCGPVTDYAYQFLLNCQLMDSTGDVWATAFDAPAKEMLGISADELQQLVEEENLKAVHATFQKALFKYWTLRCRVKAEKRENEDMKQRVHISSVMPLNMEEECKYLRELTGAAIETSATTESPTETQTEAQTKAQTETQADIQE